MAELVDQELGSSAAVTMKRNRILSVVDPDGEVKGWRYGSSRARTTYLVGIHGRRRGTRRGCCRASVAAAQ